MKNKNTAKLYNLPERVRYCRECTVSNQRPRITFDEKGVCSACNFAKYKRKVDWKQKESELIKLSAIKKDNVTGLQFHPEKSGKIGLKILEDFSKL